jgi:creatinine amidohydrolase
MPPSLRSYDITDLTWVEVEEHLSQDSRLIIPVGACDQYGAHLPIGTGTRIATALARDLSDEFGVLRAPAFPYGVNVPSARASAGAAALREKTLHRALNDLLACWERQGFREFILITAQGYDPHVEAIAAVSVMNARVRVIEALAVDLGELVDAPGGPQHGGEVETSLLLYLQPDAVHMDAAKDFILKDRSGRLVTGRLPRLPDDCPGSVGYPTLATAAKGQRIYAHILEKIRDRVFGAPASLDE